MNNTGLAELNSLKEKYQGVNLDIALNKIKNGYPIQYLIGNVDFYGNKILVSEDVLIPRYETEFLVDLVIKKLGINYEGNIIDIGTGSGAIAISVAKALKNSIVTGIDISDKAIKVANKNVKENKLNNVRLNVIDVFKMQDFNEYDIIISNPPYISYDEEVGIETKHEPQNALFADDDGLKFYIDIIKKASLSKKITDIFFEIGMNQAKDIKKLKEEFLREYQIDVYKDLANKDRYIHIYLNK